MPYHSKEGRKLYVGHDLEFLRLVVEREGKLERQRLAVATVRERQMQRLLQHCYTVFARDAAEYLISDVQRRVRQRIPWMVRCGLRFKALLLLGRLLRPSARFAATSPVRFRSATSRILQPTLIYEEPGTLLQATTQT